MPDLNFLRSKDMVFEGRGNPTLVSAQDGVIKPGVRCQRTAGGSAISRRPTDLETAPRGRARAQWPAM
jgi:hypothetical protein